MDFRYGTAFAVPPPEAYERLLLDVMLGDPTLFTRTDEVEERGGSSPDPRRLGARQPAPPTYPAGTWGPPRPTTSSAGTAARGDGSERAELVRRGRLVSPTSTRRSRVCGRRRRARPRACAPR